MKKIRPLHNTGTLLLTYTILFCILMAGIFAVFIMEGRSFVNHADAYDQGYFWTVEMKNNIRSLLAGDGYPLWSWDRGLGLDTKLPIDPFMIIAALFPAGSIELGYSVAILLRLYFAGIAFICFCKVVKLDNFQALLGSLFYVSATWVINVSLIQGQFIDILIVFPLLAAGVDRICQGKSPWLFILSVALAMSLNYYLAYMAAIGIIIYLVLRYFHYGHSAIGNYMLYIIRFILYGTAGIMISAVFVFITIRTVLGASTGSGRDTTQLLYDTAFYMTTGLRLLSRGYAFSYTNIGIPVLALIVLFVPMAKPSIRHTHVLMSLIMLAMTCFPFFGSMFNGFGYVSNRWYFMLIFFLTWTAAEHLDLDKLTNVWRILLMLFWWGVLVFTTLGLSYLDVTGDMSLREAKFVGGNLAAGFVMILVIICGRFFLKSLRARQAIITLAVVGTLMLVWTVSFQGKTDFYFLNGEVNGQLISSTQRAGSQIEDEGFYRIDQVDWINISHKADQPVNENLWWRNNTIYLYDSKLPASLTEFNKLLGNNLGYSKRVYMQSNGNRMGMDFMYGIKYFLGNDPLNGKTESSDYAGYGFSPYGEVDGVEVFRNKYDAGLGFTYDAFIPEKEFLKLSRLEREQALLQAVVIPDLSLDAVNYGKQLTAQDIKTNIQNVDYSIVKTTGVEVDGNTFTASQEDAVVSLYVEGVKDSQLVVSFDGLRRLNDSGEDIGDFHLWCANDRLSSAATNSKNNQTIAGIVDYDLNMGYYDDFSGTLRIHFSDPGTYTFDKLYVSAMAGSNYDEFASERVKGSYRVSEYDWRHVSGTVEAASDGLFFISIPVYDNWEVYIDGDEQEVIGDANIAFMAVNMPAGTHTVELKYDMSMRKLALMVSGAGLLLAVLLCIFGRGRRRRTREYLASSDLQDPPETEEDPEHALFWSGAPADEHVPKHGQ